MTNVRLASSDRLLGGARLLLLARPSPDMDALERALAGEGAFIERLGPEASDRLQTAHADVVLVRLERREDASPRERMAEQREFDLACRLAQSERVLGLLDESLAGTTSELRDFVLPPFRSAEVSARLARILQESRPSLTLRAGNLELNPVNRTVTIDGLPVDLTFHEFEILHALLAADGGVLTREALSRSTSDAEPTPASRRADIHIYRLRSKLRDLRGVRIETVRNVGYRLAAARVS